MIDTFCDRLLSTIIGEYGIVNVLESVADKSYNQKVRISLKELIKELQIKEIERINKRNIDNFCSCPGCTGRG